MFIHCASKMPLSNQIRFNIRFFSKSYLHTRIKTNYLQSFSQSSYLLTYSSKQPLCHNVTNIRTYSSNDKKDVTRDPPEKLETVIPDQSNVSKVNQRSRLKQAVRDYGATIVVFHVAISLASLGICYAAISNGVDAIHVLTFLGFSESVISSKVAIGGSTFVMSYAVHKLFAPVRIGITLSIAPFIVRYLRKIKWLKPPKKK